jgi:UDP-N-acetylglucosamine 1-carboxyvinyltransferase
LDRIRILGGIPLQGKVYIQGSKNAALPMMAAALLHDGVSVLHGCPKIADVLCMEQILASMGAVTWWEGHSLYLDCRNITGIEVKESYARKMRSSVILLGALLGRKKEGRIGYPGGCVIGKRPINLHLEILKELGAVIREEGDEILAHCTKLQGCHIYLPMSSVGATEQGILAAVLADGTTYLHHCAKEPEILWMQAFLRGMGADITGAGTETIRISGVKRLRDSQFAIPPDRIVAGTYLCAGAITRGRLVLENCPFGELEAFLQVYGKMGGQFQHNSGTLIADSRGLYSPVPYLETAVYPGFPTDLQSPLLAVLSIAKGESRMRETIFEDRYKAAVELNRMGANIKVQGQDAYIAGVSGLHGCEVQAEELRGGAALVLAGLAAEGETVVNGCRFIQRGYECICEDFTALGGRIST